MDLLFSHEKMAVVCGQYVLNSNLRTVPYVLWKTRHFNNAVGGERLEKAG